MLVFRLGFSSWFYTAVSVWENDCSGMVILVLEVQWVPCTAAVAAEGGSVLQGIPVVSGVGWKVNISAIVKIEVTHSMLKEF